MENFENDLKKLEDIIKKLESGESGLSESMKLFEEGVSLTSALSAKLDEAENKIRILTSAEVEKND